DAITCFCHRGLYARNVAKARYGVMPRWNNRLDPVTIKMLAAYVHSLGGGEANAASAPAAVPDPEKVAANVQP
ncbi:MAG TPA: hypothetical protein PLU56_12960, partial [Sphingorhabdus lacus]|nr:hypothetical protein [Sphingorhabdus lacus]